jgi:undecaprenyl-diphosphatase
MAPRRANRVPASPAAIATTMMLIQAAVLGVVQGLTEFLPISSSAHLILARAFFGWDSDQFGIAFDVACHVGTLLAVVLYFAPELTQMCRALPRVLNPGRDEPARQLWLLVVGTIPAVLAGLLFNDFIEGSLRTPAVAAVTLTIGGALLVVADQVGSRTRGESSLTMSEALGLGIAQAAALVPGVSRSGATIMLAMSWGLRRDAAARFSFLLGVPAILAAAGYEGLGLIRDGLPAGAAQLFIVGVVTSGIVGYFTVKYFLRYLSGHSLNLFAFYRFALAGAVVIWVLR